jgi:hypothetical protein
MSLNIETTSDKPNFINYFSDPLTLPQNAGVVLTKTNLSVPIIVSPSVRVPNIGNAAGPALTVGIDGITEILSWTNIYDATKWYFDNNYGLDRITAPADLFVRGEYDFMPNQQLVVNCINDGAALGTATTNKLKVSFNTILAYAIDQKFDFYDIQTAPTYKKAEGVNTVGSGITTSLNDAAGAKIEGTLVDYNNDILTELGFNIAYDPTATSDITPTTFNWSAASSLTNWTRTGADIITSAVAGVNVAFATQYGTPFSIDPNGGWVGTVPTLAGGGTMAYGLSLSGEFGGWDNNFLSGGGTTCDDYINLIDIGWKFKANANGTTCAQIIDSKTDNAAYTGAAATLPQIPLTEPPHLVHVATAGEKFFIHIKRGAIVNGTTEFIFSLFSGTAAVLDTTDNLIYVCKRTFAGGSLRPTLVALSDNVLGNVLSGWNYIPITNQSLEQGDYFATALSATGGTFNKEFFLQPEYGGTFLIPAVPAAPPVPFLPEITATEQIVEISDFWRAWGLISYDNAVLTTAAAGRRYFVNNTTGTNLLRTFKNKVNILNSTFDVQYIIGQNGIGDIWNSGGGEQMILNQDNAVANLPSVLHVAIDNLDLKNFNGTLLGGASATGTGAQTGQRPSVDRVIGTIPLPVNTIIESDSYLLQYEPLNLIYRPINNPISFTINQLQVGIFYYDFLTNIRQNLKSINGICNLELNIKAGYQPKKPQNNLLPY